MLKFEYDLLVPLESLPRIFSASHRKSLQLEVDYHNILCVEDDAAARFLELVDEGFNLRVMRDGEVDMIEEYRVNWHSQKKQGLILRDETRPVGQ